MTTAAKVALVNATIFAMLTKLYFWDHTSIRVLLISAPFSFVILNLAVWIGVRVATKRKAALVERNS
jgi:hypothetical protein